MQLTHPIHQAFSRGFYSDSGRDYEVRLLLGYCTSGGADAGEVLATIDALDSGHEQAWADAWLAAGRRVAGAARDSFAHGHRESAASAYLRAANYLSTAFDGLDGMGTETQRMTVFAEHRAAWDSFVGAGSFVAQRLSIPYDGTTMPGWLVRPADDERPRPTLVLVNGSDGSISALWCAAGHAALTRGYNVVLFDGPGQQSMLFEKSVLFRPDWEAVL
ncbi:dipeptidyl aminopeptidase, partial [Gordonia sp. i37]